jgi:starch-binding outer membrane protein, SusD/RagB family
MHTERIMKRSGVAFGIVLAAALVSACEVTNPGPVAEEYLTLPTSQQGFINGAEERLARAVDGNAWRSGAVAREFFPGGQTGSGGLSVYEQAGQILYNGAGQYSSAQQARWIAEEAGRQFEKAGNVSPDILFQALMWAGYANRFLGENFCESVIDGGPLKPGSEYFKRSEEAFTKALALNVTAVKKQTAYAGRAQARLWLENFDGAAADAGQVPQAFQQVVRMNFTTSGNADQRNQMYWNSEGTYRSYTIRYTFYDQYYTDTGDPRTPWQTYAKYAFCTFSLQGFPAQPGGTAGQVPCTQQLKFTSQDSPHVIADGGEMRLIEAEVLLQKGDWQGALAKINALRTSFTSTKTGQKLAPWTATSLAETWTLLKRERGIQLWLEGRRMADQRRWEPILGQAAKTPGSYELPNFEARSKLFTDYPRGRELTLGTPQPRALCFNISDTERNTNDNIPDVG